jgi:hypothetical protein
MGGYAGALPHHSQCTPCRAVSSCAQLVVGCYCCMLLVAPPMLLQPAPSSATRDG